MKEIALRSESSPVNFAHQTFRALPSIFPFFMNSAMNTHETADVQTEIGATANAEVLGPCGACRRSSRSGTRAAATCRSPATDGGKGVSVQEFSGFRKRFISSLLYKGISFRTPSLSILASSKKFKSAAKFFNNRLHNNKSTFTSSRSTRLSMRSRKK